MGAALAEHALSYGVDIDPICRSLGINPSVFQDIIGRVSLDRFCRLLEACAQLANDDAFGLKYSAVYPPGSSGPYGYGLMVAPTVRDFLQFQERHMPYVSETSYCDLKEGPDGAVFHWSYSPVILKRDQFVDMGIALVIAAMGRIAGPKIAMIELGLERPLPRDVIPFRKFLCSNIHFGEEMNWLKVPRALLDQENPKADVRLFELMDMQCQGLHPVYGDEHELLQLTREFVTTRLRDEHVALGDVARYFGVSERTLQRRLSEQGTSLNDIKDEVRRELAGKFMTETALSAADVCYRLGYSAPSAFTRSFQRWYGQTPREYRRQAND